MGRKAQALTLCWQAQCAPHLSSDMGVVSPAIDATDPTLGSS